MLDFLAIKEKQKSSKDDFSITVYPDFKVLVSDDLMIRGHSFYAIWDDERGMWSREFNRAPYLVDRCLDEYAERYRERNADVHVMRMCDWSTRLVTAFSQYTKALDNNVPHVLDEKVTFLSDAPSKTDYRSKRLGYDLSESEPTAYLTLMNALYAPDELRKLEWGIGSIFCGEPIDKFFVMYGKPKSGKSTTLAILLKLFGGEYNDGNVNGYCTKFSAEAIGDRGNRFSLTPFATNPLIAYDDDADLSRITLNTNLNQIASHEDILVEEKGKDVYTVRPRAVMFVGTNHPVRINDVNAGIIRRLMDVYPKGVAPFTVSQYKALMKRIDFERGAIANRCMRIFQELGPTYYATYTPQRMMRETNPVISFIGDNRDWLAREDPIRLKTLWEAWQVWCEASNYKPGTRGHFLSQMQRYYEEFYERKRMNGEIARSVLSGFHPERIYEITDSFMATDIPDVSWIHLRDRSEYHNQFDALCADYPAQYAGANGTPLRKWDGLPTKLKGLDTSELHYVKVPENHIVIDFDLTDENGEKSLKRNMQAAEDFPPTYAELSKSGKGLHLHYIYDGNPTELAPYYDDKIEVKVFKGNSSLRRKETLFNDEPVRHLKRGDLPFKRDRERKEREMLDFEGFYNEKALRTAILRNLRKMNVNGTKPSIELIKGDLDKAFESGLKYDVTDLKPKIISFASNSTHHASWCLKQVQEMKFASEEVDETVEWPEEEAIVFFDIEIFPNLFVVCYKEQGEGKPVNRLVNPSAEDIRKLCHARLIGFNNRQYDNHILYGRMMGDSIADLYKRSGMIINGTAQQSRNAKFGKAYNLSYADVLDFSSKKQGLKKWEIELGIHHLENEYPWDEPVPEDKWGEVCDYCDNDVVATEAVFDARHADFLAREILAQLSGLTVNDTNQQHAAAIIFEGNRNPQSQFVYTDLNTIFPGYSYEVVPGDPKTGKKGGIVSTYRGEVVGEGGYVYAEPGAYENVLTLDVESMHPNSIIQLNLFGDRYTKNFKDLLDARLAIKHHDFDSVRHMFDGRLAPYLEEEETAEQLAYALKIVINSVYGLTAARFDCAFKDPRNVDNIVAKRGALFMLNLKHEVQERGYTVAHIKTDSIKIPNPTPEIIAFVNEYGAKYGYRFDEEASYERFCLVDDANYVAKKTDGEWTATGAKFKHPYIFKTLFSHEEPTFADMAETKSVAGGASIYLDKNEGVGEDVHRYIFVGAVGAFVPVREGCDGGLLIRRAQDGKESAVAGSKGYRWEIAELVRDMHLEDNIDMKYYKNLNEGAIEEINKVADFDAFMEGEQNA